MFKGLYYIGAYFTYMNSYAVKEVCIGLLCFGSYFTYRKIKRIKEVCKDMLLSVSHAYCCVILFQPSRVLRLEIVAAASNHLISLPPTMATKPSW